MKKIPLRKCVVTQEKHPKNNLLRVIKTPEGIIKLDLTGKANGRGAYVLKSEDVILKAQAKDLLSRALEVKVPPTIYEELLTLVRPR